MQAPQRRERNSDRGTACSLSGISESHASVRLGKKITMEVTINELITQLDRAKQNSDDVITSIGTVSGGGNLRYIVHCKRADGSSYDVNINAKDR